MTTKTVPLSADLGVSWRIQPSLNFSAVCSLLEHSQEKLLTTVFFDGKGWEGEKERDREGGRKCVGR